jgi:ABC-2 type transport system permease protein
VGRSIVRISSFLSKEIREILRQPWLVMRLILGPFLILLLVGLGYTSQARTLRAFVVLPSDEPETAEAIDEYVRNLGPQFELVGTTMDEQEGLSRLRVGQVDTVVVVPPDAYETILSGQQATVTLYHNEIDPQQVAYVEQFGEVYVQEINRRIMLAYAEQAKRDGDTSRTDLQEARAAVTAARQAADAGDRARAQSELERAQSSMDQASAVLAAGALIMGSVGEGLGIGTDALALGDPAAAPNPSPDTATVQERAAQAEQDLADLDAELARFENVPANVMVSPLTTETLSVATFNPSFMTFYAPSVLALILQHVAISIGALALVRERLFGAVELFRVAPISAFEILLGKYGSYLLFVAVIAAVLTAAMIFLLGVPLFGTVANLVLSILLLVFASLGIGMAISATSGTDSQAIQSSMLVLLASMFFSGFVFPLASIIVPVRWIGYLLPVTYSITNLQNVMLKGQDPAYNYIITLAAGGIALFIFTWWRYRRGLVKA